MANLDLMRELSVECHQSRVAMLLSRPIGSDRPTFIIDRKAESRCGEGVLSLPAWSIDAETSICGAGGVSVIDIWGSNETGGDEEGKEETLDDTEDH